MNIKHRWLSMADDKGIEAAFNKLLDEFTSDQERRSQLRESRFYRWVPASDGQPPAWLPITERQASNSFDSDMDESQENIFWLGDDGTFHKVTARNPGSNISEAGLDEHYSENPTAVYSWQGDLLANDQVVGTVTYTDH